MRRVLDTLLIATIAAATLVGAASAQEGLATSSSLQGHNTVQQAPSGGRTSGAQGAGLPDHGTPGVPSKAERDLERRNSAATQICKGC